ncbi:MAG: hypothetical protein V3V29_06270 [Acidimicrobiia bacterium]
MVEPFDPERVEELLAQLSRPAFLRGVRQRGREYGHGLWKLEPSDLADLLIPRG